MSEKETSHGDHPTSRRPASAGSSGTSSASPQAPGFIRVHGDGVLLSIKLQPRASANEIGDPLGDELRIRVTAPPVDAAANDALVRLLAEELGCPRSRVTLVRGHASRHKLVSVQGLSLLNVLTRLRGPRS